MRWVTAGRMRKLILGDFADRQTERGGGGQGAAYRLCIVTAVPRASPRIGGERHKETKRAAATRRVTTSGGSSSSSSSSRGGSLIRPWQPRGWRPSSDEMSRPRRMHIARRCRAASNCFHHTASTAEKQFVCSFCEVYGPSMNPSWHCRRRVI